MLSKDVLLILFVVSFTDGRSSKAKYDFDTCMSDVGAMKAAYTAFYKHHLKVRSEGIATYRSIIKQVLDEIDLAKPCYNIWFNRRMLYVIYKTFSICGGVLILHEPYALKPEWTNWSDMEFCAWYSETMPKFHRQYINNLRTNRKCNIKAVVKDILLKNWRMCNRWVEEGNS